MSPCIELGAYIDLSEVPPPAALRWLLPVRATYQNKWHKYISTSMQINDEVGRGGGSVEYLSILK